MKCWICGAEANSAEHKIKKSTLIKTFGQHFKTGMLHYTAGKFTRLPGPNSKKVRYEDTLCEVCNNTRTQPFDDAYETFFDYVRRNADELTRKRFIDFKKIYGDEYMTKQVDLFKYFVKLFGCDLSYSEVPVPKEFRRLLKWRWILFSRLRFSFAVNEVKLQHMDLQQTMGIGNLVTTQENLKYRNKPVYRWDTYFAYLQIFYWYRWPVDGSLGSTWFANSRYVYLGSYDKLT